MLIILLIIVFFLFSMGIVTFASLSFQADKSAVESFEQDLKGAAYFTDTYVVDRFSAGRFNIGQLDAIDEKTLLTAGWIYDFENNLLSANSGSTIEVSGFEENDLRGVRIAFGGVKEVVCDRFIDDLRNRFLSSKANRIFVNDIEVSVNVFASNKVGCDNQNQITLDYRINDPASLAQAHAEAPMPPNPIRTMLLLAPESSDGESR